MKNKIGSKKFLYLMRYLGGILLFAGGSLSGLGGQNLMACFLFMACMVLECILSYLEDRRLLSLRLIFSLSWLFGIGLEALKLSEHDTVFSTMTYFCMGGFYFLFLLAYDGTGLMRKKEKAPGNMEEKAPAGDSSGNGKGGSLGASETCSLKRLWTVLNGVALLGTVSLLIEAVVFHFAFPLFVSDTPHAYTDFHITGIHYFVVSWVFIPALSILYIKNRKLDKKEKLLLILLNLVAFVVPILLLSKLQLVMTVAFGGLIFLEEYQNIPRKIRLLGALGAAVLVIGLFVLIVENRHYPEGYLSSIFAFRDSSIPVSLQYPYIYITNNYANLDLLVKSLTSFSYGSRMLYPFVALTGLKFLPGISAWLASAKTFITVPELTTLTILYDAYGDFGLPGTLVFGLLLGFLSGIVTQKTEKKSLFYQLLHGQLVFYLGLSFFSTWFSNPTVWFYFFLSLVMAWFCQEKRGRGTLQKVLKG